MLKENVNVIAIESLINFMLKEGVLDLRSENGNRDGVFLGDKIQNVVLGEEGLIFIKAIHVEEPFMCRLL